MTQLPLDFAPPTLPVYRRAESPRDRALRRVARHAEKERPGFTEAAAGFIWGYLLAHGQATSEQLVDVAIAAGFVPHDARAFGPVFLRLSRQGRIRKVGTAPRAKGHGCSGGNVWDLARG